MQAMIVGIGFSLVMALHYYFGARRHDLPSWSDAKEELAIYFYK